MTNGQFKSHTRLVIRHLDTINSSVVAGNLDEIKIKLDELRADLQAALED